MFNIASYNKKMRVTSTENLQKNINSLKKKKH